MLVEEKIKLINDVFAPKTGEKVLFLVDIPHNNIEDNKKWFNRREMAKDWFKLFNKIGEEKEFSVDLKEFYATGTHNTPIPTEIINEVKNSNLVIAMTEYSASSSLLFVIQTDNQITRAVSMPQVEKRMEKTAFKADYTKVKRYANALKDMLNNAVGAKINFSTGDSLYIDLRYRTAFSEAGECTHPGQFINFPSGESYKVPYEATSEEVEKYGKSKTKGVLPVMYDNELVKYVIENNRIIEIIGAGKKAKEMTAFFKYKPSRSNIAELGIGCNPEAIVTGNVLEDEKVGLHIAYGTSTHLKGKIESDTHQDIVYAKDCPVEGTSLTLINKDGSEIELITNSMLRYDLL
jgi:leucyl aminopeptidase (aminopeptidase T)